VKPVCSQWSLVVAAILIVNVFALCSFAEAQQPKKIARIGYLSSFDVTNESTRSEALRGALRELGYIEGQNIAFEYRYGAGQRARYPELAAELVRLQVDIILAAGGTVEAAKNATKTIPIVMTGAGVVDPVEAGLVESLARPGGNVTGITNFSRDLGGKRLELLKETVTKISTIAVLYEAASPSSGFEVKKVLPEATRALGLTLRLSEIGAAQDFDQVFGAITRSRPDGLYVLSSPLVNAHQKRIAGLALNSRLPSLYGSRSGVDAGGLMSYSADLSDSYRRVAYYVDKIIKGANPADLPVEQPTKFELVINLITAKQIGLTIPPNVLARADRVIK
jgi:putative ABC transport system substrate-binding protein